MSVADSWVWLSNNASNVIALCALVATFWQAYISRNHNKLSVKPYLTTWTETSLDGYVIVKITNNGVGPAHIKSFKIFADNQRMIGESLEPHIKCLTLIFPEYQFDWYGSYLGVDYMMPSTEQKDLIAIKFTGDKVPTRSEVDHRAKRVRIEIEYESIYKEKFKYDSEVQVKKQNC
jgi:hypothetical protein